MSPVPPWLDTPEEAGAILVAVLGVLATIGVGIVGACAAVYAAWRAKLKPLLTKTHEAAETAADQLTPNHGSSARDSLGRIERTLDRFDRSINRQLGEIRADMTRHSEWSDRQHSELFRRVNHLESPMEDTRP